MKLTVHEYVPFYTRTVLLPFKEKIVYDGLLEGYSMSFGSGIKYELKERYMAAKQHGRIIVSFNAREPVKQLAGEKKDWKPLLDDLAQRAKKLRSSSGEPTIHGLAFSLVKASIEFAGTATENSNNSEQLWKGYKRVEKAMRKIETVLYRSKYFEKDEI